jgi:hypothetical protein
MDNVHDKVGEITEEMGGARDAFPASTRKQLPKFLRLVRRVAVFSADCAVCRDLQNQIIGLGSGLVRHPRMTRENLQNYLHIMKATTRHFKKGHGLVEERQYVKRFLWIGLAVGLSTVVFGLILIGFGFTVLTLNVTLPALALRVIFSGTVGLVLDKKAKKSGRVL